MTGISITCTICGATYTVMCGSPFDPYEPCSQCYKLMASDFLTLPLAISSADLDTLRANTPVRKWIEARFTFGEELISQDDKKVVPLYHTSTDKQELFSWLYTLHQMFGPLHLGRQPHIYKNTGRGWVRWRVSDHS